LTLILATYNRYFIFSLLLLIVLLITISFFFYYKEFKKKEQQKLAVIYDALQSEKEKAVKNKLIPQQINALNKKTNQKIRTINIAVLELDFSLHEIFT